MRGGMKTPEELQCSKSFVALGLDRADLSVACLQMAVADQLAQLTALTKVVADTGTRVLRLLRSLRLGN